MILEGNVTAWFETRRVLVLVLALGLFAMAARNVTDPDVWWHLRTGQVITQTHAFQRTDPFSFTRQGQTWVNHEWLSDVLLYGLYCAAGWGGLIVVFAAMTATALMLVFVRSPGRPYAAALPLVLGAYASAPSWGVRPQTISLLLASAFLLVLERSEKKAGMLWWSVPLILLWVNLHAEFALGIALIALFLAGEALEAGLGFQEWSKVRPRLRNLALATAACLAVVLVNPNGLRMYLYPIETLRSPAMQQYIAEWASPNFHDAKYLPFAFMLLAVLYLLAVARRTVRPRDLLLLLVMTAGALRSVRHIPIFVLVAVPILSGLAESWWHAHRWTLRATTGRSLQRLIANGVVLAAFLVFGGVRVERVVTHQAKAEAKSFPSGAASFLISHHLPGPILNHYNFGGYFIWKLYPDYPVYIDGRADLYGDQYLRDFAQTYYVTDPGWYEPIQKWGIRTVVLPPGAPMIVALRLKGVWRQVYSDSQATILTRG
jgi:hypothetical protein